MFHTRNPSPHSSCSLTGLSVEKGRGLKRRNLSSVRQNERPEDMNREPAPLVWDVFQGTSPEGLFHHLRYLAALIVKRWQRTKRRIPHSNSSGRQAFFTIWDMQRREEGMAQAKSKAKRGTSVGALSQLGCEVTGRCRDICWWFEDADWNELRWEQTTRNMLAASHATFTECARVIAHLRQKTTFSMQKWPHFPWLERFAPQSFRMAHKKSALEQAWEARERAKWGACALLLPAIFRTCAQWTVHWRDRIARDDSPQFACTLTYLVNAQGKLLWRQKCNRRSLIRDQY